MTRRPPFIVFLFFAAAGIVFAQPTPSIEGVWQISGGAFPEGSPLAAAAIPSPEQRQAARPQPSLIIFTKGYYSQMYVMGGTPRPAVPLPKDRRNATDAEKLALYDMWQPFTANAGTYTVSGSTLSLTPTVAKNETGTTGESSRAWELKFDDADTVWMIPTGPRAAIEPRLRLSRLE